ncbi:DUF1294 domain-containing protein [Geobacillus sp. BMUD]|uniref:DUF1294 domain-containing protein n=1 Tax=Geobacillus TaxID=129337 RepID=UPI0004DF2D36|nr:MULTISPECIES: DUF1294 domain-containing protein [Geobacillus]NNU83252.1 DUF1294 domain-containing protein [Geobacillus sp. BMUD]
MVQYGIVINVLAFLMMGLDKFKAKHRRFRIAERTLWLLSLAGGATGAAVGMYAFRHKTRHRTFRYGLPLLSIAEWLFCWKWIS